MAHGGVPRTDRTFGAVRERKQCYSSGRLYRRSAEPHYRCSGPGNRPTNLPNMLRMEPDMNVKLLQAPRPEPRLANPRAPTHPEYPIEQAFGSDDPLTQQQLMQQASRGSPEPSASLFVADYNGLRVLARSESALNRVAEALLRQFGATLLVGAPAVRYGDHPPVLEPYMVVLVNAPASYLRAVRQDFARRHGRITRLAERGSFVLEGEAPLAHLLGYHRRMREMLAENWDESHVATWLSRYALVGGNGPEAA